MKRFHQLLIWGTILVLSSCQTLEMMTIEYLIPADLNFPPELKHVGVVNNVNTHAPDNHIIQPKDSVLQFFEIARKVSYHDGNPTLATESLAKAIAEGNYFDTVILSDSALRANDITLRETTLSREEVNELVDELDVDFIIALENIQLKATRTVSYGYEGGFIGTVDVKIFPSLKVYLPNRNAPLAAINASDSIFWDKSFSTQVRALTGVISDEKMIEEASVFAGTIPMKHLIPYWREAERVYFNTNQAAMRDAAILVQKGDWDGAYKLWQQVYNSKGDKNKMRAAFNIALYHEVKDNIDEAESWVAKAYEHAKVVDKLIEPDSDTFSYSTELHKNVFLTYSYLQALKQRQELHIKLNLQMNRFDDENQ